MRGRTVHGWDHPAAGPVAHAVVLPGLGLHRYLHPLARALAEVHVSSTVLDLPGFGVGSARDCPPDVRQVGAAAAAWVAEHAPQDRPLVVFGHSTGSLAALHCVLDLQGRDGFAPMAPALLVMAGPVFPPRRRSLARVVTAAPLAYRLDPPTELVALAEAARDPVGLVRLLRSGLRASPERDLAALRVPLLLTAGRADAYAPEPWMTTLAAAATGPPSVRTVVLPGSHNNPFTHARDLAREVRTEVGSARARGPRV